MRTLLIGVFLVASGVVALPASAAAASYFVDCSAASSGNGSQASPFNSLAAINAITLAPGDAVSFRRATTCTGSFVPKGSGTASAPVTIGAYGTGRLPAINAGGATQAVLLSNVQYVQVRDLDLSAPGNNTAMRRGVYVLGTDAGTLRGIVLQRLVVHDVRGLLPTSTDIARGKYASASGGIVVEAAGSTTPTSFDGIQILDNEVYSVDRQGIYFWSNWCQRPELAGFWFSLCGKPWNPHTNVTISRNDLRDIGGDGIVPKTATGVLVERNHLEGFNRRGNGVNAGMWTANAVNVTFQFNESSGGFSTRDGMGYDVDHSSDGVVFQYNFSHDNDGGFFLLCPYDKPTKNFIIRYNISVNDEARAFQVCPGQLVNGQIYNNTIYIGDGISQQIVTEGTNASLAVRFTNNIVARHGSTGTVGWTLSDPNFVIDHNVLYAVPVPSGATNTVTGAPMFAGRAANDPIGYRVLAGSSALGSGVSIAGNGGRDYFGNSVPASGAVNIGAYQGGSVCAPALLDIDAGLAAWALSGPSAAFGVGADPGPGFVGQSFILRTQGSAASLTREFSASGDLLIDVRLRASQTTGAVGFHVLDGAGQPVARISLAGSGKLAYTDGAAWIDSVPYSRDSWHRVGLRLHPATGRYDVIFDGRPVASPAVGSSAGSASVRLNLPTGAAATFAADDVLVQPCL